MVNSIGMTLLHINLIYCLLITEINKIVFYRQIDLITINIIFFLSKKYKFKNETMNHFRLNKISINFQR